jgi:uncharacterized protein YukE
MVMEIKNTAEMKVQATDLDREADAVEKIRDAWKNSTLGMDDALPEADSRAAYHEAVEALETRLDELATTLHSWATGFRNIAEVYKNDDVFAAYAIAHQADRTLPAPSDGASA